MSEKNISFKAGENRTFLLLKSLNGILGLTPKELSVVNAFLSLNREFPCSTEDRKRVQENLRLKNVQTLNNIIKSITNKRVFVRTGNGYKYCDLLTNLHKVNKITINVQDVQLPARA